MFSLLDNPIIQSAALPFVAALGLGLLMIFLVPRWYSLAMALSFFPIAFLIAGFQLLPLNSTRKILVVGLAVTVLVQSFKYFSQRVWRLVVLAILALVSVAWVLWPIYISGRVTDVQLLLSMVFVASLLIMSDYQRAQSQSLQLSIMVLAGTVAVTATLGASALLGQLSGALSAVLGALLFISVVTNRSAGAEMMAPPAVLMAALFSLAAVFYSGLSWYSLVCLTGLSLIILIPVSGNNRWIRLSIQLVAMLPLVALAIYLAIPVVDESSGYY